MPLSIELPATLTLKVGARGSILSQKQVEEVFQELKNKEPACKVLFDTRFMQTPGDKDLKTSLKDMGKDDFFTRSLDQALLQEHLDIAIHSAKDLPDPLPEGLEILALTKGKDPRDSLLLKEGMQIEELTEKHRVACSSYHRQEGIRALNPQVSFVDVRGTVESRVRQWQRGDFEALVVAEAALIRLGFSELYRIFLPYTPTQHQGRLAILGKKTPKKLYDLLKFLFSSIDSR